MKKSAGIILYRRHNNITEVLLVHPGGPFWTNKDEGAWSIPKGEVEDHEEILQAALRELYEETGITAPEQLFPLTPVKQKGNKIIYAWAGYKDIDATGISSNHFEIEWPPRSGKTSSFAEIDKAGWFTIPDAQEKINPGQIPLLIELEITLAGRK